mgnify:CR=1 FL=1
MQEEFGYKDAAGRWVAGFGSRRDAISAAAQVGMTQVVTAGFSVRYRQPSHLAAVTPPQLRQVLTQPLTILARTC